MVLLLFALILLVAASFVLATKLNVSARTAYRQERSADVLAEARQALVGVAVAYPDTNGLAEGPGQLPCPDTDSPPDGFPNAPCGANAIGRLPWRVLGMNDLRDPSGEELWYSVSANYRDNPKVAPPLNSTTAGQLRIDGQGDMVAMVIAPGPALSGQNGRPSSIPGDYLEDDNNNGDNDFVTTAAGDFNDQVMVISRQDLMTQVTRRVLGEAEAALRQFQAANGYYPYAAAAAPNYFPIASNCGDGLGGDDLLPLTDAPGGELAVAGIGAGHWYRAYGWSALLQYHVGQASSQAPAAACAGSVAGETTVNLTLNGQVRTVVP